MRLLGTLLVSAAVSTGVYAFFAKRRGTFDEEIGDPVQRFIDKQRKNFDDMAGEVRPKDDSAGS